MTIKFKTVFIWNKNKTQLYIFYKYNTIGLIPTEVNFKYRNKIYSTIKMMEKLSPRFQRGAPSVSKTDKVIKMIKITKLEEWYDNNGNLNKKLFMNIYSNLL